MRPSSISASYVPDAVHDLRIALRRMRRAPALASAIVLTIGLGLGAAAAIFAIFQTALIDSTPFANSERLVHLWEVRAGTDERSPTSYPTLVEWRTRAKSFTDLEGYNPSNITVGVGDEARMLRGAQVTAGFFRLLGVRMSVGRDFLEDQDARAGAGVAIVSERFAHSAAGGIALNSSITINGTPHVIVGVLPNAFHFALLQDADIWVPLIAGDQARADRSERWISVVGRLREDAPLMSARARLSAVMSELAVEYPDALAERTVVVVALRDALLGNVKSILITLLIAVVLLLVTMATNLALLMLARYAELAPELAMRSALGATRARVLRQLLAESVALGLVGGALAFGVGHAIVRGLLAAIPEGVRIGMPYLAHAALDARVVGVMAGVATLLVIGFGLGPALLVTKPWGRGVDARTTLARGDRRLRRGLVAAQTALTVVLLVSSGLLVMSFSNLVHRDVGFIDPEGLVTARVSLSGDRYQTPAAQQQFYEALLAGIAALPGVRIASVISQVPGSGGGVTTFETVDRPRSRSTQPRAALRIAGGDYFSTLGIPLLAGRAFESRDRANTRPVAVVSARFARLLSEDGAAIGRRLRLAATGDTAWEVVGVAGNVQIAALDADSPPVIYVSHLQTAENRMSLILRTGLGVTPIANQVRAIVKALDPGVPVYAIGTLHQQLSASQAVFSRRFPMILCSMFAASALALALVALYAICTHEVLTRRREFGIRLALGGSPAVIRQMILNDVILLTVVGISIGAFVAMLASRSLNAVLFGITATDWRVYGAVAAGVLVSAVLATLRPALRAASVNPSVVMREE